MARVDVRRGMPSVELPREEFEKRFRSRFADPAFRPLRREIDAIVEAAWDGYRNSRKAPVTRKAGTGFADPDYEISVDWLAAASRTAEVDGYLGYMEPYATSHQALDKDETFQEETRNAARALGNAVKLSRAGQYQRPDEQLHEPNPK